MKTPSILYVITGCGLLAARKKCGKSGHPGKYPHILVNEGGDFITKRSIPLWVPIVLAVLFGVATALLWVFHIITFVQAMLPFAFAAVVLMFIETAVLKARCGNEQEGYCVTPTCAAVRKFTPMIIISGAVFITFVLAVFATDYGLVLKTILAFIGSLSFWGLLFAFVSLILSIRYCR